MGGEPPVASPTEDESDSIGAHDSVPEQPSPPSSRVSHSKYYFCVTRHEF